jgi:hypothetical protein
VIAFVEAAAAKACCASRANGARNLIWENMMLDIAPQELRLYISSNEGKCVYENQIIYSCCTNYE